MPYKDIEKKRACGRETARRIRERFPQRVVENVLRTRDPAKHRARATLNYHKSTGRIQQQPCQVCGDTDSQGHHDDYSRPLQVTWLCRIHHAAVHKEAAAA